MPTRSRPVVVSTRVSQGDRALIRALAEVKGVSVCQALHEILIQSVHQRLAELVAAPEHPLTLDAQ